MISWTQDAVAGFPQTLSGPKAKRKHTLLPVLIVLFVISYGLMSLLAVEQDRTIAAQRSLIISLLSDSTELSRLKVKIFQKQRDEAEARSGAHAQNPASRTPLTQNPSSQIPSARTPLTQAPATPETPAGSSQRNHNAGKVRKAIPQRPPLGIADIVDGRRIASTI